MRSFWVIVFGLVASFAVTAFYSILNSFPEKVDLKLTISWILLFVIIFLIIGIFIREYVVQLLNNISKKIKIVHINSLTKKDLKEVEKKINTIADIIEDNYAVVTKELVLAAKGLGLVMVYKQRALVEGEVRELLPQAEERVIFVGICLRIVTQIPSLKELLVRKVAEDVSFQFAFLTTKEGEEEGGFDFYEQRANDEKTGSLKAEARNHMNILTKIRDSLNDDVQPMIQIAQYTAFPYMPMVIIDNVMFVGSYLYGESCPHTPMYKYIKIQKGIFNTYKKHFDDLWENAEKI